MEIKSEEYEQYLKEKYLTFHEASQLLEVSEEELLTLIRHHGIPTHQVAGAFLRIKKADIEGLKNKWRIERGLFPGSGRFFPHRSAAGSVSRTQKLADFWYFNDFYILCSILVVILLYFIVSSQ